MKTETTESALKTLTATGEVLKANSLPPLPPVGVQASCYGDSAKTLRVIDWFGSLNGGPSTWHHDIGLPRLENPTADHAGTIRALVALEEHLKGQQYVITHVGLEIERNHPWCELIRCADFSIKSLGLDPITKNQRTK